MSMHEGNFICYVPIFLTLQSNLGHATAAFTLDVYGHTTDRMKEASAKRMQTFIEGIGK